MNLSEQLHSLHEGGLVKIPIGLQKAVVGGAKSVIMGQVLNAVISVIGQYNNILRKLDKKHPNYKLIEKIIKTLNKYVSTYKVFKPRKSNVRKKKITIKPSDMKPYKMEADFDILLTTSTRYSGGTAGSITTTKGDGPQSEIPLAINFSRIGGTIDVFKSQTKNAMNLHMMMRDGKELSGMSVDMLNTVFPEFKKFVKNIRDEMFGAISILNHELTHVVQRQTGQGFNHSDFNREGGYIQLKGKSAGAYDRYAVGSKEIKAYLLNQVDDFYTKDHKGLSYNDAIKTFVSDRTWFKAFKDTKKRNLVIRDFTIALGKDRRKTGFGKQLSEQFDYYYNTCYSTLSEQWRYSCQKKESGYPTKKSKNTICEKILKQIKNGSEVNYLNMILEDYSPKNYLLVKDSTKTTKKLSSLVSDFKEAFPENSIVYLDKLHSALKNKEPVIIKPNNYEKIPKFNKDGFRSLDIRIKLTKNLKGKDNLNAVRFIGVMDEYKDSMAYITILSIKEKQ